MRVNFINNSCVWISLSPPLLTFKPPTFSLSSFFLRLKLSGKWGHWNNSITLGADIAAAASDGGDVRKYTHSTVYTKMSLFMRDDGIDDLRWDEGKGKRGERKSFSQRMCGGNIFYRTFSALTRFLARFSHSLSNSFYYDDCCCCWCWCTKIVVYNEWWWWCKWLVWEKMNMWKHL